MRKSVVFAVADFLPLVAIAQRAEEAGYYRVWTTETPGRDAMVRALTIALRTSSIQVGTGIAYAFTRAPLAMAATAADINVASGGRFSLGIGAGTQGMRTRWYGIDDFDHPATRLVEYGELLRQSWASAKSLNFEGRFYRADYGELDGVRPAVPLWGSGTNPTMLRIAARFFDGVALHPLATNLRYLDDVALPALQTGSADRITRPEVAAWQMTSVHPDEAEAVRRAQYSLAFYFSTPSYGTVADATGWGDVAERIRETYRSGGPRWDQLATMIPDEMVKQFCLVGTPSNVRQRWESKERALTERGVTETTYQIIASADAPEESYAHFLGAVDALAPKRPRSSETGPEVMTCG